MRQKEDLRLPEPYILAGFSLYNPMVSPCFGFRFLGSSGISDLSRVVAGVVVVALVLKPRAVRGFLPSLELLVDGRVGGH